MSLMELLRPNPWILYLMGNSGFRKVLFLYLLIIYMSTHRENDEVICRR